MYYVALFVHAFGMYVQCYVRLYVCITICICMCVMSVHYVVLLRVCMNALNTVIFSLYIAMEFIVALVLFVHTFAMHVLCMYVLCM